MSYDRPIIPVCLGFIVFTLIAYILLSSIPKNVTREITPINGPIPEVYEVKTNTTYYYSIWVMPNGEKTVYICHREGIWQFATFGMTQAVHPDGTPVTPEELGIVVSQDTDKENQSP